MESEAGLCIGIVSFFTSWVTAGHEIDREVQKRHSSLAIDLVTRRDPARKEWSTGRLT